MYVPHHIILLFFSLNIYFLCSILPFCCRQQLVQCDSPISHGVHPCTNTEPNYEMDECFIYLYSVYWRFWMIPAEEIRPVDEFIFLSTASCTSNIEILWLSEIFFYAYCIKRKLFKGTLKMQVCNTTIYLSHICALQLSQNSALQALVFSLKALCAQWFDAKSMLTETKRDGGTNSVTTALLPDCH